MSAQAKQRRVGDTVAHHGWQWFPRVCASLLRATPVHAFLCVLLYIASQLAFLAALLLPWKLLVVLSSEAFPRMLPAAFERFQPRELVLVLAIATIASFLMHLASEISIGWVCGKGGHAILATHQKTGLFNSHREQASRLYRRLLRSISALVCCVVIIAWLGLVYPLLLFALGLYLCFGLLAALNWNRASSSWLGFRPPPDLIGKAWWGGGFIYAFGWMIGDHWHGDFPGLTIGFISLLLFRQTLVLSAQLFQNFRLLNAQRSKVDALFLADVPWVPTQHKDDGFQALWEPWKRQVWTRDLLKLHGDPGNDLDIRCRSAENGKVVYLTATDLGGDTQSFFLKLYHRSLEALAHHERAALQVAGENWPAPVLLGEHDVEGHFCLVFSWNAHMRWLTERERTPWLLHLREELFKCLVPETLIARYDYSQPSLSRRLQVVDWNVLRALAPNEHVSDLCKALEAHWCELLAELDAMPRHLVLPELDRRRMAAAGDGRPTICNWTRWRWEPVGAGWPFSQRPVCQLRDVLANASRVRRELRGVDAHKARRAAILFAFERCWAARDFIAALDLAAQIWGDVSRPAKVEAATPADQLRPIAGTVER